MVGRAGAVLKLDRRWAIAVSEMSRLAPVLGSSAIVALGLLAAGTSHARRQPYYVLRTSSENDIRPRILFAVDTSGSMSWRAQSTTAQCEWTLCEGDHGAEESRISVARRVIQQVVQNTQEQASFALMTFEQYSPPTTAPSLCNGQRFNWSTYYGYFEWDAIQPYSGVHGAWRLCQGTNQKPWPYLRWDNLGVGASVTQNDRTGALPASPLISTDAANIGSAANAIRGVQWFPKFMGTRVQLNDTTDPDQEVLAGTIGDYGDTQVERLSNVWEHDFYYWPYVDGFPHYADTTIWPFADTLNRGGLSGEDPSINQAKLYAPFYLDLSATSVPTDAWGPASQDEALQEVMWKTNPLIEGGLDVSGGTPWATVIGDLPSTAVQSNEAGSHTSVSSYLKFIADLDTTDFCTPTSVVMVTDGVPSPGEGGATLYRRLAALRDELGVRTYAVGYFTGGSTEINNIACAATGACDGSVCSTPCDDIPAHSWDTCRDEANPATNCAYVADSAEELSTALTEIVQAELQLQLNSGPSFTANDFGIGGAPGGAVKQTSVSARTEYPGWKGHVERSYCGHRDSAGALLGICQPGSPEFAVEELEATFGPCTQSRTWDAGECLQQTTWSDRRIYSENVDGTIYRISDADGTASAQFVTNLTALGLRNDALGNDRTDAIAAFVLGENWPEGWKLPGIANASPVVIRRVPRYQATQVPTVNIRDPHCAGRRFSAEDDVPDSLVEFARDAWSTDAGVLTSPSTHYEYQEAVMIGDDLGILHAFQYNSGNELWGFLPRAALTSAVAQSTEGVARRGQPDGIDAHHYGIAATVNQGWVYDDRPTDPLARTWRHLGIFGMGNGGREYYALDLSHMSPSSTRGPFELMWSTETTNALIADARLGETWARPALTYHVSGDTMAAEPDALVLIGSGYPTSGITQGHSFAVLNALNGAIIRRAQLNHPTVSETIDAPANYGALVDPVVASQCLSSYWAEAQEAYIADPAGRLYRWDLGRTTNHESDSVRVWADDAIADASFTMPACLGAGSACTVSSGNPGDPFQYSPAVSANDRIDDASGSNRDPADEYLIALISGSADDASIDGRISGNTFHSSLYILVDNHEAPAAKHAGFSIPAGAPKMALAQIGSNASYLRLAISDIARTRTFSPFPGAAEISETRNFTAATRPIRSPRIDVIGVVDSSGQVVEDNEVYQITFTVYEPAVLLCDPRFYDDDAGVWYYDRGDTFDIVFRLTASSSGGFNLLQGSSDSTIDFGSSFTRGLVLQAVTQQPEDPSACPSGNCGVQSGGGANLACDNNVEGTGQAPNSASLILNNRSVTGFSPVE